MGNCAVPEYVLQTDVSQRQTQVGLSTALCVRGGELWLPSSLGGHRPA